MSPERALREAAPVWGLEWICGPTEGSGAVGVLGKPGELTAWVVWEGDRIPWTKSELWSVLGSTEGIGGRSIEPALMKLELGGTVVLTVGEVPCRSDAGALEAAKALRSELRSDEQGPEGRELLKTLNRYIERKESE